MDRKIWTHGFFTNTFNSETNQWTLTRTSDGEEVASGPKAAPLGVLGSALTRKEKAEAKVAKLEEQLAAAREKLEEAERLAEAAEAELLPALADEPEAEVEEG